ncbi:dimethylarginine dimethylaminohydrolase family protein [Sporolactobacillus laevolacticus]|uniref:dimethylarginine dimethylaminohydrolase family protein n=1 Tax=Sporolactobacillus laevolacticus TaxID=33018 RepID=UPI0025B3B000|nr:arginine deiminase family protein [Sporolactobacillus laevolacticus]MDN3955331.1 arginine deiminase family protein [Sporolactobacillus laevolacticus]
MSVLHKFLDENMVQDSFENAKLLENYWSADWGNANAVGKVRKVFVHRPGDEILELNKAKFEAEAGARILRDEKGAIVSYCLSKEPLDLAKMQEQHDRMTDILKKEGVEVISLIDDGELLTNNLFARDVGMVIPGGLILARFALKFRYGEARRTLKTAAQIGMPVLASIQGQGFVEGGSFMVFDRKTAIVGRSIRVNQAGIDQLRAILSWQGMELIVVDLPSSMIHLDEVFNMVDVDKALVDPSNLPHWFLQDLQKRGIKLIYTDPLDPPMTTNCLCLAPGKVLFTSIGERTIEALEKAGVEVIAIPVDELNKMGGGIHCSSLVLQRDNV